jgi:hypothetical protein
MSDNITNFVPKNGLGPVTVRSTVIFEDVWKDGTVYTGMHLETREVTPPPKDSPSPAMAFCVVLAYLFQTGQLDALLSEHYEAALLHAESSDFSDQH